MRVIGCRALGASTARKRCVFLIRSAHDFAIVKGDGSPDSEFAVWCIGTLSCLTCKVYQMATAFVKFVILHLLYSGYKLFFFHFGI